MTQITKSFLHCLIQIQETDDLGTCYVALDLLFLKILNLADNNSDLLTVYLKELDHLNLLLQGLIQDFLKGGSYI